MEEVAARAPLVFAIVAVLGLTLALSGRSVVGGERDPDSGGATARAKAPGYLLLNLLFLGAMLGPADWKLFPLLLSGLGILAAGEITEALGLTADRRARAALSALGIVYVPAGLAALFVLWSSREDGGAAAFVYLCVAANDAFAQLIGARWGRRRLAPALSPGKTVAGAAGGLAAAALMGLALAPLPMAMGAAYGLGVGAAALAGDLLVSAVKRAAGLKDFGRLLGPQGGLLDRVDGLLLAAVVAAVWGWLLRGR